ncbi:hypothetical protein DIPPA_34541 [Diplonema papillatum]|nr:hypothetical protein DIPPA_34541 [Diplonema papillatum]
MVCTAARARRLEAVIKASSQPFTPPACPLAAAGSVPFAAEEDTSLFTDLPTWRVGARASGPKPAAARPAAVAPPPDPIDLFQTFTVHPEPKPIDEDSCPAPTGQQLEQGASWSQKPTMSDIREYTEQLKAGRGVIQGKGVDAEDEDMYLEEVHEEPPTVKFLVDWALRPLTAGFSLAIGMSIGYAVFDNVLCLGFFRKRE